MELELKRIILTDETSIGTLSVDGQNECYTLEDKDRLLEKNPQAKIPHITAIPRGRYRLELRESPHFDCITPHLLNVPNYEFVLIHWGNYSKDTDGCILVGTTKDIDFIGHSKDEFSALMAKLQPEFDAGNEVWITIQ